ncbi:MAG: hypothetical protein OEU95_06440 [Nitrospirota bacterium]|nr:hypothetical protein [Nitrospirota bacterium]
MKEKVKKSLTTGINRVKWVANYLAERTRAETSAVKLLYECTKLEEKIDDIHRDIGKRLVTLKEKGKTDEIKVFNDPVFQQAFDEIVEMRKMQEEYKKKAEEINKLPE